jgi:hypothetical protein
MKNSCMCCQIVYIDNIKQKTNENAISRRLLSRKKVNVDIFYVIDNGLPGYFEY